MTADTQPTGAARLADDDGRFAFHELVYLEEGTEVTVGRPGNGEFVVLPVEGAELLRKLAAGATGDEAARWFKESYGEPVDVHELVLGLDEVGFVRRPGEAHSPTARVRWQRIGQFVFSPLMGLAYLALLGVWVTTMVKAPDVLLPRPRNLFFTPYVSVLVVVLFFAQMPFLLAHEAAHALAGRRLGLHTKLAVGRRMQFVVFETTMNGLVAVAKKQRFLPILAGMMTDLAISAILGLTAASLLGAHDAVGPIAGLLLSLSYLTLMRFLWQFLFFLRTDVYYLVATVLGCVDLHTAASQQLSNRLRRGAGLAPRFDPASWHPRDRTTARWYSVMMLIGYAASAASMVFIWIPVFYRMITTVVQRFSSGRDWRGVTDSVVFLLLNSLELLVVATMIIRQRSNRRNSTPPLASLRPYMDSGA